VTCYDYFATGNDYFSSFCDYFSTGNDYFSSFYDYFATFYDYVAAFLDCAGWILVDEARGAALRFVDNHAPPCRPLLAGLGTLLPEKSNFNYHYTR